MGRKSRYLEVSRGGGGFQDPVLSGVEVLEDFVETVDSRALSDSTEDVVLGTELTGAARMPIVTDDITKRRIKIEGYFVGYHIEDVMDCRGRISEVEKVVQQVEADQQRE